MGDMEWYYTPDGGTEQNLLGSGVRMLTFDGFGMPRRIPESTRLPLMDGVHALDEEIYTPERYMHLVLLVEGTSYSDWKTQDDALVDKLIGIQETSQMGVLRIVKPNAQERTIRCALIEYPNDHDLNYRPEAARRILTFYAPKPHFFNRKPSATLYVQAIDGSVSGYLWPAVFPWGGYTAMNYLTNTVTNGGTARTWPMFYLTGPVANPIFYNATTNKWAQAIVTLTGGTEYLVVYMEQGVFKVPARTPYLTDSTFSVGSEPWDLQVGDNTIIIAGSGLTQELHYEMHYDAFKML